MSLKLYSTYSQDAALAGFPGAPQMWCDNQFAVLPGAVLAFITLGRSDQESRLASPSQVVWRPQRVDYAPADERTWFPTSVREVYDRSGAKHTRIRHHQVFLRASSEEEFLYAGEAHLGSHGGPLENHVVGDRNARFTLVTKLSRDAWLRCGGYQGWQVEVNHRDHIVAPDAVDAFDGLFGQLQGEEFAHLCMTRYEEDSFSVFTNPSAPG